MTKSMQISQKLQNQQIIIKVDFIDSFRHPIIAALIDVFAAMQFSPIITSQIFSEVHKKNSSKVREQLLESENLKKLKPVFSDYAAICLFVVSLMWHVEVDFECAMAVLTDGLMNIHKHGNRFFRLEFQKWVVTLDHGFWSSTIQNGKWYEQGLLYGRLNLLWKLQIVLKRHIKKQRRGLYLSMFLSKMCEFIVRHRTKNVALLCLFIVIINIYIRQIQKQIRLLLFADAYSNSFSFNCCHIF